MGFGRSSPGRCLAQSPIPLIPSTRIKSYPQNLWTTLCVFQQPLRQDSFFTE